MNAAGSVLKASMSVMIIVTTRELSIWLKFSHILTILLSLVSIIVLSILSAFLILTFFLEMCPYPWPLKDGTYIDRGSSPRCLSFIVRDPVRPNRCSLDCKDDPCQNSFTCDECHSDPRYYLFALRFHSSFFFFFVSCLFFFNFLIDAIGILIFS